MRVNPQIGCRPYFELLSRSVEKLPFSQIEAVVDVLLRAYRTERTVFVFGNGGSAALASHFACDLGKGTVTASSKRFRVMALTDNVPLMTAWANDSNYADIFAEQLANFAMPGDLAFAISASGNSSNVLKALKLARQTGLTTAGLSRGRLAALRDHVDARRTQFNPRPCSFRDWRMPHVERPVVVYANGRLSWRLAALGGTVAASGRDLLHPCCTDRPWLFQSQLRFPSGVHLFHASFSYGISWCALWRESDTPALARWRSSLEGAGDRQRSRGSGGCDQD